VRRTLVDVTGLSKKYGRVTALDSVALSIREGEILGLIGPNGSGKTTLFECLAGVQPADAGRVDAGHVIRRSDLLFYLPDGVAPWPDQTVEWALHFALRFFGGRTNLHAELVERLGLAPLMAVRLGALSKGQRKRALLALGLLTPQPILLIDEPFEGLDLRQSRDAANTLRWHASTGRTLFLSIHQILDAARLCDRFVLLSNGRVCADGTIDELGARAAARGAAAGDFEEVFLALA
jgi:ABC-2 type transport system ATP-binding protein